MPPVKSLSRATDKWVQRASVSQGDYEAGVKNPRADWAEKTMKAEANYEKGVQRGIANKSFAKGVQAAGTSKWQQNAVAKGPTRWAQGIGVARTNYEKGFAPFRETLEGLDLPARGPKGSPENIQRVAMVADALHKRKLELLGK